MCGLNVDSVQEDVLEGLKVVSSIVVSNEMVVSVYVNQIEISQLYLKWILPSDSKLSHWSQIENSLTRYKNLHEMNNLEIECFQYYINRASKFVKKA